MVVRPPLCQPRALHVSPPPHPAAPAAPCHAATRRAAPLATHPSAPVPQAALLVARYAGQPELLPAVEAAIRVQQNNDQAVKFGTDAARVLEKVVLVRIWELGASGSWELGEAEWGQRV